MLLDAYPRVAGLVASLLISVVISDGLGMILLARVDSNSVTARGTGHHTTY
jgi:hypothetical protein